MPGALQLVMWAAVVIAVAALLGLLYLIASVDIDHAVIDAASDASEAQ